MKDIAKQIPNVLVLSHLKYLLHNNKKDETPKFIFPFAKGW